MLAADKVIELTPFHREEVVDLPAVQEYLTEVGRFRDLIELNSTLNPNPLHKEIRKPLKKPLTVFLS